MSGTETPTINIRITIEKFHPAENEEQFQTLKAAYLGLFNAPSTLRYVSYTKIPFAEMTVADWFKHHVEEGVHYYAALNEDEQIVGISAVKVNPILGCEMIGLAVHPDHREKGIGQRLIEESIKVAQKAGFQAIDVAVFADNKTMLRLLIGLDFIPVRMNHRARADGADVVFLKKYF